MPAVSSTDPGQAKEENIPPVPLSCILCPKKLKFSDESHLLTHISSKSHLHQKFSIEFKSKSDPAAKEQLERFEAWYAEHRIERLMSKRLAARGTKKPTKRNRAAAKPVRKSTSALETLRAEHIAAHLANSVQTPENLPRLAHWNTAPAAASTDYNSGYYQSPLSMKHRSAYPPLPDDAGAGGFVLKHSTFMPGLPGANITAPPSDIGSSFGVGFIADEDAQASRLKGIIWPGMDLFDSATPDQKKMRNQRKGSSIADHLKLTSQAITATETVWGPGGELRKERDIYASPSDEGSPQSTPPRRKKPRSRDVTSSVGTPLSIMKCEDGQDSQPTTKHTGRLNGIDMSSRRQTRSTSWRNAAKNSTQHNADEVDHDETDVEDTSYSAPPARPKGPFDVYFEGGTANTIDAPTGPAVTRDHSGGSLDPVALSNRPALQQLDPNLPVSDHSSYFKQSSSTRFYDHGTDAGHMAFRSQASPYGTFSGMAGATLGSIASQPRNSSIYPPFDNQMFGGMSSADASAVPYNGSAGRRMGFGSYGMDPNSSPFGYSDQREGSMRDPSFADPTFPGTPRLFEL